MLSPEELTELIHDRLLPELNRHKERYEDTVAWLAGKTLDLYIPKGASAEYEMIRRQSKFNVLNLVVKQLAQDLRVEGYRPTAASGLPTDTNAPIWDMVWQPNRMDARQRMMYKSAIKFGQGYATVLPGTRQVPRRLDDGSYDLDEDGRIRVESAPVPVITPYSPRKFVACYDDEANDEWPEYGMCVQRPVKGSTVRQVSPGVAYDSDVGARFRVFDADYVYDVEKSPVGGGKAAWGIVSIVEHHMGVVPVVRWLDEWDCDELPAGKVWPLIDGQKQLDQTTFHVLMIQNFASWRQRFIAGLEDEDPGFRARIDAVWKSTSPDTKFGEFSASDPTPLLRSREAQLQFVSAVAQVAPHQLVLAAGIANISADALVALQTSHDHDVDDHKISFGESDEQMLRLGGLAIAHTDQPSAAQRAVGLEAWYDTSAQVRWADTTPRSLAQIADALGKLAMQLGIPPEALWERIPGVTQQDIDRWKELSGQQSTMDRVVAMLDREMGGEDDLMEDPEAAGAGVDGSDPR